MCFPPFSFKRTSSSGNPNCVLFIGLRKVCKVSKAVYKVVDFARMPVNSYYKSVSNTLKKCNITITFLYVILAQISMAPTGSVGSGLPKPENPNTT